MGFGTLPRGLEAKSSGPGELQGAFETEKLEFGAGDVFPETIQTS